MTGEAYPGAIAGRKKGEEATANFGETQEQEISTLKQSARAGVVRGSFSPADNRITLTPNADLSTFSHEMGHWYMATLIDLVRTGQANDSIREDVAALFKQFGVADVASWDALGFEGQRKYHEQFASWVEQYLAEAKAPKGLKRFFINLGKFIRDVYRNFTGGVVEATQERYRAEVGEELPALSAEVRQVLDRMVMSEKAVNEYQAAESLHPLFDTKPADMSEADWLETQRAREEADEEGMAEIVQRRAKDDKWYDTQRGKLLREKNKEAKEYRAKVREGVERSLSLPRACGGVSTRAKSGSLRTQVFPAHAGVFFLPECRRNRLRGLPRACGGVSCFAGLERPTVVPSPRMRGCFHAIRLALGCR